MSGSTGQCLHRICRMFEIISLAIVINNGNRTEWSPVRSVIVRVTKEITRSFDLFDHECDNKYDNRRIG